MAKTPGSKTKVAIIGSGNIGATNVLIGLRVEKTDFEGSASTER